MGAIEPGHLVVILAIVLIIFGPGKLSDIGGTLGRGLREFRDASEGRAPREVAAPPACAKCAAPLAIEARYCSSCGAARS